MEVPHVLAHFDPNDVDLDLDLAGVVDGVPHRRFVDCAFTG
ncbi:hypothetical protein L483_14765 [Pseudomonas putida H8234]|nr:hypothetical protein L483_14765 [Pseudomonas putida H8234]